MKKLIIWIFVLIVIGFIATAFIVSRNNSTLKSGEKNFAYIDTAKITKIFLADKKDNTVLLVKQDSGLWKLNNTFDAQPEMLRELLRTIMYVTVRNPVPRNMHNNVISRMSSHSTKVEIYAEVYTIDFLGLKLWPREKLVRTYYVGDNTQDNTGTFMLMEDADMAFVVHIPGFRGFLHTRYSPRQFDWLDHGIFRYSIPKISSVSVKYPDYPDRSFILKNPDNENFEIYNVERGKIMNLDTIRTINYLNSYTDVRYETSLNDLKESQLDSIRKLRSFTIIKITDRNGDTKKIELKRIKSPEGSVNVMGDPIEYNLERLYGVINNKDVVFVQYFVFGSLMKDYSYFIKNQKDETQETNFQTIL